MPYTPILATLGYLVSADRSEVLLIRRDGRADDPYRGIYNGLGGKLAADEDVVAGMRREIVEEAGLVAEAMQLCGTVSWPGFGPGGEDWFGFVFRIEAFSGTLRPSGEGSLSWQPVSALLDGRLPLHAGDRYFLPLVFAEPLRQFHGVMPYVDGQPLSWTVSVL